MFVFTGIVMVPRYLSLLILVMLDTACRLIVCYAGR